MKEILIVVNETKYIFAEIRKRTIHAPMDTVAISKLLAVKPHGNANVDNSEVRVCKINGVVHLLSGYSKIKELVEQYSPEVRPVITITAKIMAQKYLAETLVMPVVKTNVRESTKDPITIREEVIRKQVASPVIDAPVVAVPRPSKESIADKLKSAGFKVK